MPDLEDIIPTVREWVVKAEVVMTEYATVIRYPDAGLDIPLAEARKAVAIARRIRKEVRRLLPPAALRHKRK